MLDQVNSAAFDTILADVGGDCSSTPQHFEWSVIVPFYNEANYLRRCLASLAAQARPFQLILVDNASTDGSGLVARRLCNEFGLTAIHLHEARPGKVAALQAGLAAVTSEFVATCDADTIYPPGYLETANAMMAGRGAVAGIAATTPASSELWRNRAAGLRMWLTSRLLPQQCLNGGAGQVFRVDALRRCGGFDPAIWNWVLEDHEIIARIEPFGQIVYAPQFVCHPSVRPKAVDSRGWRLTEQLHYHLTSARNRLAFFHDKLAPRLRERSLPSEVLRSCIQVSARA